MLQMINKSINFDVKFIECTVSGTNFVYIVLVSCFFEAYNHNRIPPLFLVPKWRIDREVGQNWNLFKIIWFLHHLKAFNKRISELA